MARKAKMISTQLRVARRAGKSYLKTAEVDGAITSPFIIFVPGRPCARIDGDMNPRALRELADYMEFENERHAEKEAKAAARKAPKLVSKRLPRANLSKARSHRKAGPR